MIRRLFTAASVLSLLLCLGTAGVWARSLRVEDTFAGTNFHGGVRAVVVARGRLLICRIDDGGSTPIAIHLHRPARLPFDPPTALFPNSDGFTWPAGGIAYAHGWVGIRRFHYLLVPAWMLCGLTALLPGWWLISHRARQRQRTRREHNLCLACGYDLRASTDRCPECATPIPAKTEARSAGADRSQD